MLNIGDTIYHIDYEQTGSCYIVKSIQESTEDNEFMKPGKYYLVEAQPMHGLYPVAVDAIDAGLPHRFYSTPEKAHEAFVEFNENKQG